MIRTFNTGFDADAFGKQFESKRPGTWGAPSRHIILEDRAPGKPTADDGYTPPKGWDRNVRIPIQDNTATQIIRTAYGYQQAREEKRIEGLIGR